MTATPVDFCKVLEDLFRESLRTEETFSSNILSYCEATTRTCVLQVKFLSVCVWGAWLASWVEHVTVDLGVVSLGPILGVQFT